MVWVKILLASHVSFINSLELKFHPKRPLNSIEAIKLTKRVIFFEKSMIDSKLISKHPSYILVFFFPINQAKSYMEVHGYSFPLKRSYFGP